MHVYGLIGKKLDHSFSKKYFTEKFEREKIPGCTFELFTLADIAELPRLIKSIDNLKGLAVTIPYKESVIHYLDNLSVEAGEVGAVNCIGIHNFKLSGYNTDITGFEKSIVPLLRPHHNKALVLGTGGASKAVQYVLKKQAIPFLIVSRGNYDANKVISYTDIDEMIIREYRLVINCTPVGMSPDDHEEPALPYEFIGKEHFLYDLVYSPAETNFLKKGREQGALIKNGYEMLVLQAEENWRIWNEL